MKVFWPELEVNWTYYVGGQRGGLNQVYLTPGLVIGRFRLANGTLFTTGVGYQIAVAPNYRASRRGPRVPSQSGLGPRKPWFHGAANLAARLCLCRRVKASGVGSFAEDINAGLGNMTSNFSRRHVVRGQQVLVASKRPACNGDDRRQLVLF
jgi:hypothetical protein